MTLPRALIVVALALTGCHHAAAAPVAPVDVPPLPPDSPTVIGALLDDGSGLALDPDQRQKLVELDDQLRPQVEPLMIDIQDRDRELPGGAHSGARPGGGDPTGGAGFGGGHRGRHHRAGAGDPAEAAPAPLTPAAAESDRAAIEDLELRIDTAQRAAATRALAVLRDDQQAKAKPVIEAYWASEAAHRDEARNTAQPGRESEPATAEPGTGVDGAQGGLDPDQ